MEETKLQCFNVLSVCVCVCVLHACECGPAPRLFAGWHVHAMSCLLMCYACCGGICCISRHMLSSHLVSALSGPS